MEKPAKKHLKILKDPDVDEYVKRSSAEFFLEAVKAGRDISAALPGLLALYRESHQVPVMDVAAEALFCDYLQKGFYNKIKSLIQASEYQTSPLQALERLVKEGRDLLPVLPFLLAFFKEEKYRIYSLIETYTKQEKAGFTDRLAKAVAVCADHKHKNRIIPFLIKEFAFNKIDTSALLGFLPGFLKEKSGQVRENAAYALRAAVEAKNDLSGIEQDLLAFIEQKGPGLDNVSYCLAYHYCTRKEWKKLEALLYSPDREVRYSGFRALSVQYNNRLKNNRTVYSYLLDAFFDADKKIRELTAESFKAAERKGITIIPTKKQISRLGRLISRKGCSEEPAVFLYHLAELHEETGIVLLEMINQLKPAEKTVPAALKANIYAFLAGKHSPVCSICSNISRSKIYYSEHDLPGETEKLDLNMPSYSTSISTPCCPECGTFYYYDYDQEVDDMSVFTTIELKRLDPVETVQKLEGDKRQTYLKKLPGLIKKYRSDLTHPADFARSEAAWALAAYYTNRKELLFILKLLQNPDPLIRKNTLHELLSLKPGTYDFDILKDELYTKLAENELCYEAGEILAKEFIFAEKYQALLELLCCQARGSRGEKIVSSVLYRLWQAAKQNNFNLEPLREKLTELSKSKKTEVRKYAGYALEENPGLDHKSKLAVFIENLQDKNSEVKNEAAFSLERMAKNGEDISRAVPYLAKLLGDKKTRFYGLSALKNAVLWSKLTIPEAIDPLYDILSMKSFEYHLDASHILFMAKQNGADISRGYSILAENLLRKTRGRIYCENQILEHARDRGEDLSGLAPLFSACLEKNKKRLNDSFGDFLSQTLADIYLKQKEWEKLKGLITHAHKQVRSMSLWWIKKWVQDDNPLPPDVMGLITAALLDDYSYAREAALATLLLYSKKNGPNGLQVRELFANLDKGKKRKLAEYNLLLEALDEELKKMPEPDKPLSALSFSDTYKKLLNKELYFTNLEHAQGYRKEGEKRYIFYDSQNIFDIWYDIHKKKLLEINWGKAADFKKIMPSAFSAQGMHRFLAPFDDIPPGALEITGLIFSKTAAVLKSLSNRNKRFRLFNKSTADYSTFLYQNDENETKNDMTAPTYLLAGGTNGEKIENLSVISVAPAEAEISSSLLRFPAAKPEDADPEQIKQAHTIFKAANNALLEIEGGKYCLEYRDDFQTRFYCRQKERYFIVTLTGTAHGHLTGVSKEKLFDNLLRKKTAAGEKFEFLTITGKLEKLLNRLADRGNYLEMIKMGIISIGGGYTTDSQWKIVFKEKNFERQQPDERGNKTTSTVTPEQIAEIVEKNRYSWISFNT